MTAPDLASLIAVVEPLDPHNEDYREAVMQHAPAILAALKQAATDRADADLYRRAYDAMGAADISEFLALSARAREVYDLDEARTQRDELEKALEEASELLEHDDRETIREFRERAAVLLANKS